LNQLEPGNPVYHQLTALRLKGRLEIKRLEQALNEIVARHAVLRTVFSAREGKPAAKVLPEAVLNFRRVDLQQVPANGRERELLRIAVEEKRRPFDPAREPLIRATLVRLAENEHVLLLVLQELVTDATSRTIILQELGQFYKASVPGEAGLSELPIQYGDYASWRRRQFEQGVWAQPLAFWKQQLAGAAALLELPADYPRPAVQSYRAIAQTRRLPKSLIEKLSSSVGGEPDRKVFLAAAAVLLKRYSRQEDIIVGTNRDRRNRTEL